MEDREYSEDEKITMLTQDMEFLGDNFFWTLYVYFMLGIWGTDYGDLYHYAQNVLLGSIFVFFTILRPIPQFLMNNKQRIQGMKCLREEQLFITKSLIVFEELQTLRMNQALPENSQRVWNINLRYQRAIQRFAFTHNIVFFCNGFMVFLSQVLPLVLGFFLLCRVIIFQWLAWLLCILLLVNW